MKKVILTGDRPTGPLHLGHYIGSLKARVELQNEYQQFIMIADAQALTDHAKEPEKIKQFVTEVMLDYLSIGIDPDISTCFIQSEIPQLFELSAYFLNLVTWNRLKHNPTVKQEIVQKGFGEGVPAGFMTYPIFQAADITAFKADLVPVGEDQRPMIEQTNEIVDKFNATYNCAVLKRCQAHIPKMGRLPGIDGTAKMSKTLGNAIFLSDDSDTVAKKIKKMYTDPDHIRLEDPGKIEGNMVFAYLDVFGTDRAKIEELKEHYQRGGLGDMTCKKYLIEVMEAFLTPIRKRRAEYTKADALEILSVGTEKAKMYAAQTLAEAKKAMGISYFS
ncbi:MAG: tryptophan--tRNA ligase [Chlamydiia bacterium]|nr:tryptophan--tRNA ligase [Chlamydiia bacterium]